MCTLSVLFAYKVGLFNIGASGQYAVGAGFGFLALAVMIFGQWRPNLIALTAVLFGLFRALSNVYSGFDFLASKNSRAPKAEGIPYDKGQR